jgi:type IV pilus biogenesis protein CpaD/CtpE
MNRVLSTLAALAAFTLAGCASQPSAPGAAPSEGVVHEYRTGSILAQKEKRPATEEERERAKEIAAEIRASPQTIVGRP